MFRQVSDRREAAGATPGDEEEAEFYAFRLNKVKKTTLNIHPTLSMSSRG
jgi:hypothetical protein